MKIKNALLILIRFTITLSLIFPVQATATETKGVVVTIKPLHSLVVGVIGGTGEAKLLLAGNTSPHDFQLKPSQMKIMYKASVIFYIDDNFETFLNRSFKTLPNHVRKIAVTQKADLTVLQYRQGGAWEAHQYEIYEDEEKHSKENEHKEQSHGEHLHSHDHHDMHVWLGPENVKKIIKAVTEELSAIYSENHDIYKANARKLIRRIDALDAELEIILSGVKDKPFVVFHDAYQYFERAYGLNGVGSITFDPNQPPSSNRIKAVREKLRQTEVNCVFHEPQFSDRLVKTVIQGTNAKNSTLDPLGSGLSDGENLYFNLLKNLAKNLEQCLS